MHAKLLQLCLTLFNPMDSSPPGSSVHGILKARILEWVAISFSKETPRTVKFIETESRIVAVRGRGMGKTGSFCLMGIEFQFCKIK